MKRLAFLTLVVLAALFAGPLTTAHAASPPPGSICLTDDVTEDQWITAGCEDFDYDWADDPADDTEDTGDDAGLVTTDDNSDADSVVVAGETTTRVVTRVVYAHGIQPGSRVRIRSGRWAGKSGRVVSRTMRGSHRDRDWLEVRVGRRVVRVQRFRVRAA